MRHQDPPSPVRDGRRIGVGNVIVIALVVGVAAALLRSLVFRGAPAAQAVCSVAVGLAIAVYGGARLFDPARRVPSGVYVVIVGVGLALTLLWASFLF